MKLKSILISFVLLYLVVACDSAGNRNAVKDVAAASSDSVNMTSILSDDGCFEKKMEQWFARFNQLQNEGYSMNDAHQKAIALVALEFKACGANPAAGPQQK